MRHPQEDSAKIQIIDRALREYDVSHQYAEDMLLEVNYDWDKFANLMKTRNILPRQMNSDPPAGVLVVTADDDELQRAIELSKETHMEEQKRNQPQVVDIGRQDDDVMMQRAMLDSLQPGSDNSVDPRTQLREGRVPVGLRNIGNTCYVNSLLQTYFMLPSLRNLVFAVPTEETAADDIKTRNVKRFMRELQLLFGRMILTNVKWVDPRNVIDAIVDENQKQILSIGKQEDLGEFMNLFVDWMEQGLKLIDPNEDKMKEMFEIRAKELLTANEENGEQVQSNSESVHTFLMLDVKFKDFYYALDEAFVEKSVNWTTPKNFATQANKQTWFTRIPPVVMLQEIRVKFDRESQTSTKNRTPMVFQKDIDLARFLLLNKETTTKKREEVGKYRQEIEESETKIRQLITHPNIFGAILNILNDPHDTEANINAPIDSSVLTQLKQRWEYYERRLNSLKDNVQTYRDQIEKTYNEITGSPYTLYALWIHSGPTPGSGHYWTYIRNFSDDTWIKCNDTYVTSVNEEEVWSHAIGGEQSDISAYFLIYVSLEMAKSASKSIDEYPVPSFVFEQVKKDNELFLESMDKFVISKETDVDKFVRSFHETMSRVNNAMVLPMTDPRITSFGFWLKTIGINHNELTGLVIIFLWSKSFPNFPFIESEISSESASYRAAKRKLFPPPIVEDSCANSPATAEAAANADNIEKQAKEFFDLAYSVMEIKEKIFDAYQTFRGIYQNILEAFKELTLKNYTVSLKYLFHAHELITKLRSQYNVPDLPDVLAMMRVVMVLISNYSKLDKEVIDQLHTSIYVIHQVFKSEWNEPWMEGVREQVLNIVSSSEYDTSTLQDVIYSWTDSSENPPPVTMGTGLLGSNLKEEEWDNVSKEYMVEHNKFTSDFKDIITQHFSNCTINFFVPLETPAIATETVSVTANP